MTDHSEPLRERRDELLSVLSASGTLAGLCITVVAFMNSIDKARSSVSIVDDMFAVCAAIFLVCIYLGFWALRTRTQSIVAILLRLVDSLFLAALTTMTVAAFLMVYTIW